MSNGHTGSKMNGYITKALGLDELRLVLRNHNDSQIVFERKDEYFILIGDVQQYDNILPSIKRYHSGDSYKLGSGAIFDTGYYEIKIVSFRSFEKNASVIMMILDSIAN